jgi:hypothetical protein
MNTPNKSFTPIIILIVVLLIAGLGGYVYFRSQDNLIISTTTTVPESAITAETDWVCGDSVTFTYKGELVTYGTIESQGSRCWLDRNLGASRAATAYNDSEAYGDLFQWGRGDDGHQNRNSEKTTTLSLLDHPDHSYFIYGMVWDRDEHCDWIMKQNNNLWQGDGGINDPCPPGWRVPTEIEWNTERLSWSSNDYNGAFSSPLKLTLAGIRDYRDGSIGLEGDYGYYWSSTVSKSHTVSGGYYSSFLVFYSVDAYTSAGDRASGKSVRCIKERTSPAPVISIGDSYQGGIVAYILQSGDFGYDPGLQHGLIAAPVDQSKNIVWGTMGKTIPGADTVAIGTGNKNTVDIVLAEGTQNNAAKLCSDLSLNGYDDWYLPSKDELNQLFINREFIGGFNIAGYWSSSEYDDYKAWIQDFGGGPDGRVGDMAPVYKINGPYYVRCIRSF